MEKVIHLFTVFTSPPRPPSATTVLMALKSFYCIRSNSKIKLSNLYNQFNFLDLVVVSGMKSICCMH